MTLTSVFRAAGHSPALRPAAGALWSSCGPPGSPPHSCTGSERSGWTLRHHEPPRCWNCTRLPGGRQTERKKVDYFLRRSHQSISRERERYSPLCALQSTFIHIQCVVFWQCLAGVWFCVFGAMKLRKNKTSNENTCGYVRAWLVGIQFLNLKVLGSTWRTSGESSKHKTLILSHKKTVQYFDIYFI